MFFFVITAKSAAISAVRQYRFWILLHFAAEKVLRTQTPLKSEVAPCPQRRLTWPLCMALVAKACDTRRKRTGLLIFLDVYVKSVLHLLRAQMEPYQINIASNSRWKSPRYWYFLTVTPYVLQNPSFQVKKSRAILWSIQSRAWLGAQTPGSCSRAMTSATSKGRRCRPWMSVVGGIL